MIVVSRSEHDRCLALAVENLRGFIGVHLAVDFFEDLVVLVPDRQENGRSVLLAIVAIVERLGALL